MKDIKAWLVLFVAVMLLGLGCTLFVGAGLGSDAITVFNEGLHKSLHVSLGWGSRITSIIFIAIGLLVARDKMGWMSIVYNALAGFAIDFFCSIISIEQLGQMDVAIKVIIIILAQCILCASYALLIIYKQGMNPFDAIAYYIEEKTKISFRIARMGVDFFLVAVGFMLGGVVGVGTIFCFLTTGPLVDRYVHLFSKFQK
ncbi:hypothetical protein EDD63_10383 [Breznakia blatticola]|uniref:Membrane protein YczE n=1 Tax=Breznakia blatticola TaxID=1754012 RepID=A0A4R8A574_9FIRM|nr:hypothetical protein [Breznakia blatticola]TDW25796.1 hypothetical protein EDD63_10383 [Breznakia blatticola]